MTKIFHKKGLGKKWTILIIFLAIFVFAARDGWYLYALKMHSDSENSAVFEIEKGASLSEITKNLREDGFLKAPEWVFLRYLEREKLDTKIQSGFFHLAHNLTPPELAERLLSASAQQTKIMILPGWTNADIDRALADKTLIPRGQFLECIEKCDFSEFPFLPSDPELREGFFWADTYFVQSHDFSAEEFAKRLLKTFDEKTKGLLNGKKRNGFDILRMASVVEKEANSDPEEKRIIAGILWKRLDTDWLLGADATTRYASKNFNGTLTREELDERNLWNTRAIKGLPVGAICNPSLDSIRAAAEPTESEYWYYLHGNDGQVHYSVDSDAHNEAKTLYL